MRVAVVGLGRAGLLHARHLAQHPAVEEVLLVGRDGGRVERGRRALAAALAPGAPAELAGRLAPAAAAAAPAAVTTTTDLHGALAAADGVVVATSTPTHPELVRRAVAARVPVLVEKPLALEVEELEHLAAELEGGGVPVAVAFHRRYDPASQRLRALVTGGALGTVRSARAVDADRAPVDPGYAAGSGGIWRDLAVHDLDLLPWVLDQPVVAVTACAAVLEQRELADLGDADTATALLHLASGAVATVTAARGNGAGQDVRLEVSGSRSSAALGLDGSVPLQSTEPGAPPLGPVHPDFTARFERAFRAEVDAFLRQARGEEAVLTPPGAGVAALRLAVAAEESARTGAAVRLV